jgi:hypothetical protein
MYIYKYIYIIYLPASFHTRNMVSLTHPLSHSLCQGPKKCLARSLFLWLSVSVSVSSLLSRTHTHAPTLSLSVRGQNLCDSMRFWYALLGPDMLYSSLSLTLSGLEICATVCAAEFTTDFTLSLLLTLHCLYYWLYTVFTTVRARNLCDSMRRPSATIWRKESARNSTRTLTSRYATRCCSPEDAYNIGPLY